MFDYALLPDEAGNSPHNGLIVKRLAESLTEENFRAEIEKEIGRQSAGEEVSLGSSPAPARPAPGAPDIPGVAFYNDNRTMFEDFRAAFYGLGFSNEGYAAAAKQFGELSLEKAKRGDALKSRMDAVDAAIRRNDDQVVKTELQNRLRQMRAEYADILGSTVKVQKSAAEFVVGLAREFAQAGAGKVEIRSPNIAVRKTQNVVIDWGFVLIDLSTYEGA